MDLSALGARTLGIWTREQALAVLSSAAVDHLVRCGSWQVAWPGVYADGGYALDPPQRAFAAVMASGGAEQPVPYADPDPDTGKPRARLRAVAAGRTAARVWGFPLIDDDDPATGAHEHVLEDVVWWRHARTVRFRGRELRRHDVRLAAGDVVRLPNGLWITTPVRTLVDCARLLAHEALVCAVDDALHREVVALRALQAAGSDRGGMPGIRALRRAVTLADGRAEAPSETLARLVLLPVLPGLVPQVELFDAAMRLVARFDLGDEDVQLAVEADGRAGHAGDRMVAKDRRRDRRTGSFGWTTERTTWFELRRQQDQLRKRVLATDRTLRRAAA
jgi:hypothetical protein